MKAQYFQPLSGKKVKCQLCPHNCIIADKNTGRCRVRKNIDGILYSENYAFPVAINIDPVEKKPLYHFLPGSKTFSFGCAGCNLCCHFCQNSSISQISVDEVRPYKMSPNQIVDQAIKNNCESISFTYSEPTVFYEMMIDTAILAKSSGLKTIFVSNGYINNEPLLNLTKFIDAANIDIKAYIDDFYNKYTGSSLLPVLETVKILKQQRVHLEITNLIIPGLNDSLEDIEKLILWIKENCGTETPLHFSRFFPHYKMADFKPTPISTIKRARDIALKSGVQFAYMGNI
jgi:pyruvate formate lyase activating enzyme